MPNPSHPQPLPPILTLGEGFYDPVSPASFPGTTLRFRNQRYAEELGLGSLSHEAWLEHFGRFKALPGNLPEPLALRYHGYQFQHYNPDLGDGRGFLFAQLWDPRGRKVLDLGTKGSGRTRWSRGGDGKLTLKGGVREVLATEMLEALGVNTSKTFSLIETHESLRRHDEPSPTRSCVMVRLSHSHVRFGSFERHAFHHDEDKVEELLDYVIEHYASHLSSAENRAQALLDDVAAKTATLCASWMAANFVHGVLNTDNMSITGESFDYGPYRFTPTWDPDFTAAYFDHAGLYAFGRQPHATRWNIARLADALSHLLDADEVQKTLESYPERVDRALAKSMLWRLGLRPLSEEQDAATALAAQKFLQESQAGLDQFYFDWFGGMESAERASKSPAADLYDGPLFAKLRRAMKRHEPRHIEALQEPYFARQKPCSMLIDEIEEIWNAIDQRDDWSPMHAKIADIRNLGAILKG